jgi:hypothetical protein
MDMWCSFQASACLAPRRFLLFLARRVRVLPDATAEIFGELAIARDDRILQGNRSRPGLGGKQYPAFATTRARVVAGGRRRTATGHGDTARRSADERGAVVDVTRGLEITGEPTSAQGKSLPRRTVAMLPPLAACAVDLANRARFALLEPGAPRPRHGIARAQAARERWIQRNLSI